MDVVTQTREALAVHRPKVVTDYKVVKPFRIDSYLLQEGNSKEMRAGQVITMFENWLNLEADGFVVKHNEKRP